MPARKKARTRSKAKRTQHPRSSKAKTSRNKRLKKPSLFNSLLGSVRKPPVYISLLGFFICGLLYVIYLDWKVRDRFDGRLWSVPSTVYARPLVLKEGLALDPDGFEAELQLMLYEKVPSFPQRPGQYRRWDDHFELISRPFKDWQLEEPSHAVRLAFTNRRVNQLEHLFKPYKPSSVRLDPVQIASIYPKQREDRLLLRLQDVPERLINTLIAVEDRGFNDHIGISPLAMARAFLINLKSGESRQGGSTLTQQLVKNLFLTPERSYWRKINEAIMAVLLDWHYDKNSILEAYLNEVYLGQGQRSSIHGFELGSRFYFNKPLAKLATDQIAFLIGVIKGPSYYNPWKHPERALARRNLVLEVMRDQGVISASHYQRMHNRPLGIVQSPLDNRSKFPAFVDLLKRQLTSRFPENILQADGLNIYSTLDPQVQLAAERAVIQGIKHLGRGDKEKNLQTAVIVTSANNAEVLAVVADRDPDYPGFNRALDARRQIGSLIKPAIYLAALRGNKGYHFNSVLSDSVLRLKTSSGQVWQPSNYDDQFRGDVSLFDALVQSYNVPSVRLGLDIGLADIARTLHDLGLEQDVPVYPSMLLGAFDLTPLDVTSFYQGLASGGFRMPVLAIRTVLDHQGQPLERIQSLPELTIDENALSLMNIALHQVTQSGTAKRLRDELNGIVAGKTGTTDDLRDSWFAGYSGDKLAVVWLGRDDNQPAGYTGASGALSIWSRLFQGMPFDDLSLQSTGAAR